MRSARLAAVVLVLAALGACASTSVAAQLEPVGQFASPVSIAAPPGDPDRVFVVEQAGTITEVLHGVKMDQPFLNITTLVQSSGEQGLLSMAFAPDYATSHRFYVYYTAKAPTVPVTGDIAVDQFTASSPDHAEASSRAPVLTIPHHLQSNHNGGQLQFGPDGMLYLATGDGGGGGDSQGNGQNLSVSDPAANRSPLLGKVLRVNPSAGGGYTVPSDNPFMAPAAEVWMLGLRNPWRFSFDRVTGDMIIGDVGQNAYEEIDFVHSPGPGQAPGAGMNFGWNLREGLHAYSATNETAGPNFQTDPVIEENHSPDGWQAIIGGYVVRDPGLPELAGTYVFGDNAKGRLYGATLATPPATNERDLGLVVSGLTGMGEDACGRVYTAQLNGSVKRLIADTGGYMCSPELAVVPPPPGGPAPDPAVPRPGGDAPPAHAAPALVFSRALQRHIAAFGQLVLHAGCRDRCTITASAHVRIGRLLVALRSVKRVLSTGASATFTLTLSGVSRRMVRAALRRHRHPRLAVALRAVDQAGNVTTRRFTVAVSG